MTFGGHEQSPHQGPAWNHTASPPSCFETVWSFPAVRRGRFSDYLECSRGWILDLCTQTIEMVPLCTGKQLNTSHWRFLPGTTPPVSVSHCNFVVRHNCLFSFPSFIFIVLIHQIFKSILSIGPAYHRSQSTHFHHDPIRPISFPSTDILSTFVLFNGRSSLAKYSFLLRNKRLHSGKLTLWKSFLVSVTFIS